LECVFAKIVARRQIYDTYLWSGFMRESSEKLAHCYFCGYFACNWWFWNSILASIVIFVYMCFNAK